MFHKYWPYLLIILCLLALIIGWPLLGDLKIVWTSKINQQIITPTPTVSIDKNEL